MKKGIHRENIKREVERVKEREIERKKLDIYIYRERENISKKNR